MPNPFRGYSYLNVTAAFFDAPGLLIESHVKCDSCHFEYVKPKNFGGWAKIASACQSVYARGVNRASDAIRVFSSFGTHP